MHEVDLKCNDPYMGKLGILNNKDKFLFQLIKLNDKLIVLR